MANLLENRIEVLLDGGLHQADVVLLRLGGENIEAERLVGNAEDDFAHLLHVQAVGEPDKGVGVFPPASAPHLWLTGG